MNFRNNTGVNIVTILRGNRKINIPDAKEMLFPYDKIIIAGSDENIQKLIQTIQERKNKTSAENEVPEHHVNLSQYIIENDSVMIGKTVSELSLQEKTECMIICIDRNDETIINIPPLFTFKKGDTLLLAGEKDKLITFDQNME